MSLKDFTAPSVSAFILAGGANRRMEGRQKIFMPLGGQTILQHICNTLKPQVKQIALSFNSKPEGLTELQLVKDNFNELNGPMAGVVAGLNWLKKQIDGGEWLLTTPGDSPFLPDNLVEQLLQRASPSRVPHFVCWNERDYYLTCLWHISALPSIERYLAKGQRSAKGVLKILGAEKVTLSKHDVLTHHSKQELLFFNINTPEDYDQANAHFSKQ